MKRGIALILAVAMCLSLCACGKSKGATECENLINAIGEVSIDSKEAIEAAEKAYAALTSDEKDSISASAVILEEARTAYIFELSKVAYENINDAYEITVQFAEDFYRAWRIGIYEENEIQGNFVEYLTEELSLSRDEIIEGMARQMSQAMANKEWEELSEEEKNTYIETASGKFRWEGSVFGFLTWSVRNAYIANGKVEKAQNALNVARAQMKELSDKYSDYENYPNLKGYYTTTSSFLEFVLNPTGTFDMLVDTINDYMNEARDYSSDLNFIFVE